MKSLAESITLLASQLDRVKKVPNSKELCHIINEFPGMMEKVMDSFKIGSNVGHVRMNSCEMHLL